MGNVIVLLDHADGKLNPASLPAITFGRRAAELHGGELLGLLVGGSAGAVASEAAKYLGKVLVAEGPALARYLAETFAAVVAKVAKENNATVVCATANNFGKDVMPRAAGLLDAGMASDIIGVVGPRSFKRPQNAGNAI